MQKAGGGSIVNISSMYGLVGAPAAAAYQAAKGAVKLLTKSCAVDYAKYNIRVNSVHPGIIKTPIFGHLAEDKDAMKKFLGTTLMGRPGEPLEVAYSVLFLASDESSFTNGAEMVVDGGYTAV
jgi:cyclopentanol dehydrogenase